MRLPFLSVLLVGVAGSLVACEADLAGSGDASGDGGSNTPPPAGPSEADARAACTVLQTAFCQRQQRCRPLTLEVFHGDLDTCVKEGVASCTARYMLPGSTLTLDKAQACATSRDTRQCTESSDTTECVLGGTQAAGAACADGAQCASGQCNGAETGCGTCTAPTTRPSAAPTSCATTTDCPELYACKDGACVEAGRAAGQACDGDVGETCLGDRSCGLSECIDIRGLASPGEACGGSTDQNDSRVQCRHGVCARLDPNSSASTCVAISPEGGPCSASTGPACAGGYRCNATTSVCELARPDYATCAP